MFRYFYKTIKEYKDIKLADTTTNILRMKSYSVIQKTKWNSLPERGYYVNGDTTNQIGLLRDRGLK